jgi:O-antigen/teichoic acid export membrane protein
MIGDESPDLQQSGRNSFRRLVADTAWSLVSSVFLVIAGIVLNLALGNLLGEGGLGVYTLAAAIFMVTCTLSMIGVPIALTKYTAEFVSQPEIGAQFYTASLLLILVSGGACGALLLALHQVLATVFGMPELVQLLPVLALGVPFYGLNKAGLARLNGLRQMRRLAVAEAMRFVVLILLTLIWNGWLKGGLVAAVWILSLTEILMLPIVSVFARASRNLSATNLGQRCRMLGWFGGQTVLARIITELGNRLSVLLLGALLAKEQVGIYSVAALLASGLSLLPQALNKVTGPATAEMYATGQVSSMERLVNETMRFSAFLLTFGSIPLILFFPKLVGVLYPRRPGFLLAETAFVILVFGQVFNGIVVSVGSIFRSVNHPEVHFKTAAVRLATNLLVTSLLLDRFGINGAASGAAVAAFAIFALWVYLMPRIAGTSVDIRTLLPIPVLGAASVLISFLLPVNAFLYPARMLLWLVFSVVVARLWHLDKYVFRLWSDVFCER